MPSAFSSAAAAAVTTALLCHFVLQPAITLHWTCGLAAVVATMTWALVHSNSGDEREDHRRAGLLYAACDPNNAELTSIHAMPKFMNNSTMPNKVTGLSRAPRAAGTELYGKGKKTPVQLRGGQMQNDKMRQQYEQMMPESSDLPRFNLYVKSKMSPMWYPCGAFTGDDKAKQLVDNWMGNPLGMGEMVKNSIDRSVSLSLFGDEKNIAQLKNQVCANYPALKANKKNLMFGYKITYDGLEEKQGPQKILQVTPDMMETPINEAVEGVKNFFGMGDKK